MSVSIEAITLHRIAVPLRRPFVTAQRSTLVHDAVIVEMRDSDGRRGWGEAPCSWRVTGESADSVAVAVHGPLSAAVLTRELEDVTELARLLQQCVVGNSAAKMAVECALYDLAAQQSGLPLAAFLGGELRPILTDMTLSAGAPEEVADVAAEHSEAGFGTLKIKCGAGGDDRALLRTIRERVGESVVLRVDANQGWDPDQAVEVIRGWEDDGLAVELVEQPVAASDIDGLASVRARVDTPILADESVRDFRELREVIRRDAADLVNLKLAKTGGISQAIRMAEFAAAQGMGVIVGSMMESQVGIAAAASLATSLPGETPQDLDAGLWLRESPVIGGAAYLGERILLSPEPGLGILELAIR